MPRYSSASTHRQKNCQDLTSDSLKGDEIAAIQLYTMEWRPTSVCLYRVLNTVLRSENRDEIIPWFLYLKLILTGLTRIPSTEIVIWRGVKTNLSHKYDIGKQYVWWSFSSCTESLTVLESNLFLGTSGERTLFNIQCKNGKQIASYSYTSGEDEVILLPATQFIVKGKLNPSPGLYIIQLQETAPLFQLLESPIVSSEFQSISARSPINSNFKLQQRIARCMVACMYIGELNLADRDIPLVVEKAIGVRKCSYLDLNHNIITAEGARLIANVLPSNTSLQVLRFWHNYLLDSGVSYIVQALCTNHTLTELCLASNGLTDACVFDIGTMLKRNQILNTLYLDNNGIGDNGMILLMITLHDNKTLQKLYLHNNTITDQSIDATGDMFRHNRTLRLLTLTDNQLTKQRLEVLQNLANLKKKFQLYV